MEHESEEKNKALQIVQDSPHAFKEDRFGYAKAVGGRWQSQVFSFSGMACHAQRIIEALLRTGIPLSVRSYDFDKRFLNQIPATQIALWKKLTSQNVSHGAYLCFYVPTAWV